MAAALASPSGHWLRDAKVAVRSSIGWLKSKISLRSRVCTVCGGAQQGSQPLWTAQHSVRWPLQPAWACGGAAARQHVQLRVWAHALLVTCHGFPTCLVHQAARAERQPAHAWSAQAVIRVCPSAAPACCAVQHGEKGPSREPCQPRQRAAWEEVCTCLVNSALVNPHGLVAVRWTASFFSSGSAKKARMALCTGTNSRRAGN